MTNIVNYGTLGGGFRHYSGLLPVVPGDGNSPARASVRYFHIPAANAAAIFRGDIVVMASGSIGTPGAADMPYNIGTPATPSVVIGNGGGTLLGNQSMDPNITRWVPGDTTSVIAGVIVGFGPITLYQAKNGFQYAPALTECWAAVRNQHWHRKWILRCPPYRALRFNLDLMSGIVVKANMPPIRQRASAFPVCRSIRRPSPPRQRSRFD